MNTIRRRVTMFVTQASHVTNPAGHHQVQQQRGIRVKVLYGNLTRALVLMQRKMQSSGMERLIKEHQTHHIKNSEKKVLARKNLERRIRAEDFARKLQSVLLKKVRGL